MTDFTLLTNLTIPEGEVAKIQSGDYILWEKKPMLEFTNLVPSAIFTDGTILDGVGYRLNAYWNSNVLTSKSQFTSIGFIPFDGTIVHDIYVYGLNFSGTNYNVFCVYDDVFKQLNGDVGIKDSYSGAVVSNVTKLSDNYFKITTNIFSSKVKYFALSGVTNDILTPIVTIDEPIKE